MHSAVQHCGLSPSLLLLLMLLISWYACHCMAVGRLSADRDASFGICLALEGQSNVLRNTNWAPAENGKTRMLCASDHFEELTLPVG